METLVKKYQDKISGVLSCPDRVVITGTLPVLSNSRSWPIICTSKPFGFAIMPNLPNPFGISCAKMPKQ